MFQKSDVSIVTLHALTPKYNLKKNIWSSYHLYFHFYWFCIFSGGHIHNFYKLHFYVYGIFDTCIFLIFLVEETD